MAFNSYDKLVKAQRDYPKPKFATQVVDKALKKQPNNPYLLTWKGDLALQQNTGYLHSVVENLTDAHKQPIVDTELLAYMYRILIEAWRRAKNQLSANSIGAIALGTWQTTAKSLKSKRERIALWDLLFITAMEEDCWEDARFAILNQNKEGTSDKKQAHYALIIATQLAAEQRFLSGGLDDRMAKLQQDLALKLTKQAYQAPSEEAIAVNSIRELRFMGEIFGRQHRCSELRDLWDHPTADLEVVLDRHRSDVLALTTKLLWEQGAWEELETHCLNTIDEVHSNVHMVGGSKSKFWELCAWRWDLWSGLLAALHATRSKEETYQILSKQVQKCFPTGIDAKDRPLRLTYIKLRDEIGTSMLEDCKAYFQHFSSTPSCFNDLKPIVCRLPDAELSQFRYFMYQQAAEYNSEAQEDSQAIEKNWRQRHVVWLKFQYLFAVLLRNPSPKMYYDVFLNAMKWLRLYPEDPDIAFVAVYTLLNIHILYVHPSEASNPLESQFNSRILLQVTMLARHQVEKDKDKQNRTFSLLAARLHLNLGLGTVAFRLYSHTKCKEMLLDTLSPYVLSRISQTHPFEVKGYGGFSADDELAKVVGTIERMEKKTGSYLFTDISSFKWDQATDIVGLKRKLNSSLTKHICVTERRRIARFKGEPADALPELNYKTLNEVSDNIDRNVFPDFEISGDPRQVLRLVLSSRMPNVRWLFEDISYREMASQVLHHERQFDDFDAVPSAVESNTSARGSLQNVRAEDLMHEFWKHITTLTYAVHEPAKNPTAVPDGLTLLSHLKGSRKAFENLRMPGKTTLDPVDEPTMCHENMLMWCYGLLEICRALLKLTEWLKEKAMKGKGTPHVLKQSLPATYVEDLKEECTVMFESVRDVAQSYVHLLKRRGVIAIKAQIRWGYTGEQLKHILSDDDVEYYAKEYVDSALEAWSGVLKVKLK